MGATILGPAGLVFLGVVAPPVTLISLAVILILVFWWLRAQIAQLLLLSATVALVTTMAGQPWLNLTPAEVDDDSDELMQRWRNAGPFDDRLPIVLHIVLDETLSPGAINETFDHADALLRAMHTLVRTHGFRLFDSIYSRYFFSGISIPNMMNAEYADDSVVPLTRTIVEAPAANAYFADMASRGYRTAVFQSDVMDFCLPADVKFCETFPSFDPGMVDRDKLDARTRLAYLWATVLRAVEPGYLSDLGRMVIRRRYGLESLDLVNLGAAGRFDAHGFAPWFDRFQNFVAQVPRGSHVFAHFIVPHSPYVLTDTCVVRGPSDAGYYLGTRFPNPEAREQARRTYMGQYYQQATCVLTKIDELMQTLSRVPAFQDATVVIHGDHGSRISIGNFVEDFTPRDLVDNYGTLFAVRGPHTDPGVDCEFTSLPQIFRRVMKPHEQPASSASAPLPVLAHTKHDEDARVEAAMPVFGCAAAL